MSYTPLKSPVKDDVEIVDSVFDVGKLGGAKFETFGTSQPFVGSDFVAVLFGIVAADERVVRGLVVLDGLKVDSLRDSD